MLCEIYKDEKYSDKIIELTKNYFQSGVSGNAILPLAWQALSVLWYDIKDLENAEVTVEKLASISETESLVNKSMDYLKRNRKEKKQVQVFF